MRMFETPFYHGVIRKTIVAFGSMFTDIKIQRKKENNVIQTIAVPIAYSQKEKWVQAVERIPDNTKDSYASLPRIGFEIIGYNYDPTRKLSKLNTISCLTVDGRKQTYSPAPYNVDINLYFATKTQEDGLQILEQILPTFTPEHVLRIKAIEDLNIFQDVPFILNSVSVQDDYEGDLESRRFVIHTLSFTAKLNLYGAVTLAETINQVDVGVSIDTDEVQASFRATQATPTAPINQEWMVDF